MTNLSTIFPAHNTYTGDAVSDHIQEGKKAWVDGVEIIGTKAANSGILLQVVNPTGAASAVYNPASNTSAILINDPANGSLTSQSNWDLDTNGYAYDSTSYSSFIDVASLPSYTTRRKYEMWGKTKDAALTDALGVEIIFNSNTGLTDLWAVGLKWNTGTGVYDFLLGQLDASVYTNRGTASFSTALDVPALFHITVYEQGDGVVAQCYMYESDVVTDDEVLTLAYTVGSRPYKTQTKTRFRITGTAGDEWLIRGCMISDMI